MISIYDVMATTLFPIIILERKLLLPPPTLLPPPPPPPPPPPSTVVVVGFSPASYTVGENERQVTLMVFKEGNAAQPIAVEYFTTGNGSAEGKSLGSPFCSVFSIC